VEDETGKCFFWWFSRCGVITSQPGHDLHYYSALDLGKVSVVIPNQAVPGRSSRSILAAYFLRDVEK
jgi:hypothetical protein